MLLFNRLSDFLFSSGLIMAWWAPLLWNKSLMISENFTRRVTCFCINYDYRMVDITCQLLRHELWLQDDWQDASVVAVLTLMTRWLTRCVSYFCINFDYRNTELKLMLVQEPSRPLKFLGNNCCRISTMLVRMCVLDWKSLQRLVKTWNSKEKMFL